MRSLEVIPKLSREAALEALPTDEVLMRTREVAAVLGVSNTDLINMRRRNAGPPTIKVGTTTMYCTNDIETYIVEQFDTLEELQAERRARLYDRASA